MHLLHNNCVDGAFYILHIYCYQHNGIDSEPFNTKFNFSTCKLIERVQPRIYEAVQTAEAKTALNISRDCNSSHSFHEHSYTGPVVGFQEKKEAQQMLLFVTGLYIHVCHGGKEDECPLLLPATAAVFTETQVREPATTSPSAHLSLR
jgi:hypothetical protein